MFTGIVESIGIIEEIEKTKGNLSIWVKSNLQSELKVDQSVAHNGICLTVDELDNSKYRITAIEETIQKTSIGLWNKGDKINLERCMKIGDRLDGHIVQGHIDSVGSCIRETEIDGSWVFEIQYPKEFASLMVEKGSITIDGISLTCHSLRENYFSVSIIPYTYENTIAKFWELGKIVNLEFDILGKYVNRKLSL